MKKQQKSFAKYFALICMLIFGAISTAQAATFTVNSTADLIDADTSDGICAAADQSCTLRAAVMQAYWLFGNDEINFSDSFQAPNPPKTIVLTLGELNISTFLYLEGLTINGPGARQLTIDGNHQDRIFYVNGMFLVPGQATVSISDLTVQNGASSDGGGISNFKTDVILKRLTIRNNEAIPDFNRPGGGYGGGVYNNSGNLHIEDCTINNNSAPNGGGILSNTNFYVKNTTISNNTANIRGGGIYTVYDGDILNATIVNNLAGQAGGGIFVYKPYEYPTHFFMGNTIVANNYSLFDKDVSGIISSRGNNLVKSRGNSTGYLVSDFPNGIDPHLGGLQNNGGPTDTRAILFPSPAINNGNDCLVDAACAAELYFDQRGAGFPRKVGSAVDIGAYEFQLQRQSASITGSVLKPNNRGLNNALVTLTAADGTRQTTVTENDGAFRFDAQATGETYVISVESRHYEYAAQRLVLSEDSPALIFTPVEQR